MTLAPESHLAQLQQITTGPAVIKETGLTGEGVWKGATGPKGTGKGLILSTEVYGYFALGVPVFHFGNLRFGYLIDSLDQMLDEDPERFRGAIIFMDEVEGQLVRARGSSSLQLLLNNELNQSRHFNISLYWANPDTARLPEILHRQTQYVHWLDPKHSYKEKWSAPHPGKKCGLGVCNHCAAFWDFDPSTEAEYLDVMQHRGVNAAVPLPGISDCRTMPFKHTIISQYVSQRASKEGDPEHGGFRVSKTWHCMQRFYGLSNTDAFIDNRKAVLTSSDDLREKQLVGKVGQTKQMILDMYEAGIVAAAAQDFIDWIDENPGRYKEADSLNVVSIGKTLGKLGVKRRGRHDYNLESWVKARYQVKDAS